MHFYGNKIKNIVFQAKILFFILKNTFFFRKRLASLVLAHTNTKMSVITAAVLMINMMNDTKMNTHAVCDSRVGFIMNFQEPTCT